MTKETYRNSFNGNKYQRLKKRIKTQYNINMPKFAIRQYGGWAMKARGQWSWHTVQTDNHRFVFGSQISVTELLKSHCFDMNLSEWNEYNIDPCNHDMELICCKNEEEHKNHLKHGGNY